MAFAERYYLHYPKVAFGHWPPLYYAVQVLWSLGAGSSIGAWLLLQPVLLTLVAGVLYALLTRRIHPAAAVLFGLAFCLSPMTMLINSQMMAEPLLTFLTLAAVYYAAAYFEHGKASSMTGFALASCLAAYTKGSGLAMFGLPLLLAVVLNRREVLRQRTFWLPQVAAWIVHLPWLIITLPMARNGMFDATAALVATQAFQFCAILPQLLGWPLAIGLGVSVLAVAFWHRDEPLTVSAALAVALIFVMHAVSPSGIESRRLIMGWPAMLLTVALCLRTWSAKWQAIAGVCALSSVTWVYSPVEKFATGYQEAGRELRGLVNGASQGILIASQADGEGMLIAEMVQAEPQPSAFLIRANKLLADSDWNGLDYRLRKSQPAAIQHLLDSIPARFAVLDEFEGQRAFPHYTAVRETIARYPQQWRLCRSIAARDPYLGRPGRILIYERAGHQQSSVTRLQLNMHRMLGRSLSTSPETWGDPVDVREASR